MTSPDDDLPAAIRSRLDDLSETANMINDLGSPHIGETLLDLHNRLLITRSAMTRVSAIVGDLTLLSGRVKRTLIDRRGELEDAEAAIISTKRPILTEDYSSAKERNAKLAAGTLDDRLRVRNVERMQADVDAALNYGRDRHRELDRAVRDIDTRLRILSLEPNLS